MGLSITYCFKELCTQAPECFTFDTWYLGTDFESKNTYGLEIDNAWDAAVCLDIQETNMLELYIGQMQDELFISRWLKGSSGSNRLVKFCQLLYTSSKNTLILSTPPLHPYPPPSPSSLTIVSCIPMSFAWHPIGITVSGQYLHSRKNWSDSIQIHREDCWVGHFVRPEIKFLVALKVDQPLI